MEPMTAFLMAMQAAGLITSVFNQKSQRSVIEMGRKLEQEQLETNLLAIRTQSSEDSLNEMVKLRKNIGSQIVTQAARGNRGGSSYAGINEAVGNFNSDERKRRMNLLANEAELRAHDVLSGFHELQSETQLGQELNSTLMNTIQTSSLFDQGWGKAKKSPSRNLINPDLATIGYL